MNEARKRATEFGKVIANMADKPVPLTIVPTQPESDSKPPLPPTDEAARMDSVIHPGSTNHEILRTLGIKKDTMVTLLIDGVEVNKKVRYITDKGLLCLKGVKGFRSPQDFRKK